MRFLRPAILAVLIGAVVVPAYAHVPVILSKDPTTRKPYVIDRFQQQSRAIFQSLRSAFDVDVYEVVVTQPMELTVQIGVPANCTSGQEARPSVALVGPGGQVLAGGRGVYMMAGFYETEAFEEEYSGFSFSLGPELRVNEVLPGKYRIYVWDPKGRKGDYQLNYNRSEKYFSQFLPQVVQACEALVDASGPFYPTCERTVEAPRCCEFGVSGGLCDESGTAGTAQQ